MKYTLCILLGLFLWKGVMAKDSTLVQGEFLKVNSDATGKFWLYNTRELVVVDTNGNELFRNSSLGIDISWVDCSEAMKVLVFSEGLQVYLFLDNTGSAIGDQMSFPAELSYVSHICKASNDGGMWAIDEDNASLVKLDANGGLVFQKFGLDKVVGNVEDIEAIDEEDRKVYIKTSNAVFQYNEFGVFERKWEIVPSTVGFQVFAKGFGVHSGSKLLFYAFENQEFFQELEVSPIDFRVSHGKAFFINTQGNCVILNFSQERYRKKN